MKAGWVVFGALCVAGSFVGCGGRAEETDGDSPADASIEAASGTRIKVRSWKAGNVALLDELYDSELDVPCGFLRAADGQRRCLPWPVPYEDSVRVVFTDADCEKPIAYTNYADCNTPARYARDDSPNDACQGVGPNVYRLGTEIAPPAATYTRVDGACIVTRLTDALQFHAVERINPSELVSAKVEVVERNEKLGVEMLVGSDGSRVPLGLHDMKIGRSCVPIALGPLGHERLYCLGQLAFSVYAFSDAACSEPVAEVHGACGSEPRVVLARREVQGPDPLEQCSEFWPYEVGEQISLSSIHLGSTDSCQKADVLDETAYFSLGESIPTGELIELEYAHGGNGRLALEHYESEGTSLTSRGLLWDQELGQQCWLIPVSKETAYCVPGIKEVDTYDTMFADASCERRVVSVRSSCGSHPDPIRYIVERVYEQCSLAGVKAMYVASRLESDSYFEADGDGNCVETPIDPSHEYYVAGADISPADTFGALTREIDD